MITKIKRIAYSVWAFIIFSFFAKNANSQIDLYGVPYYPERMVEQPEPTIYGQVISFFVDFWLYLATGTVAFIVGIFVGGFLLLKRGGKKHDKINL